MHHGTFWMCQCAPWHVLDVLVCTMAGCTFCTFWMCLCANSCNTGHVPLADSVSCLFSWKLGGQMMQEDRDLGWYA